LTNLGSTTCLPDADHRAIAMPCGELDEGADLGDDAVAM
jgi:hypothetical protein